MAAKAKAKRKSKVEATSATVQVKKNIKQEEEIKEKASKEIQRKMFFQKLPEYVNFIFLNIFSSVSAFFIMISAGLCLKYLWQSEAPAWVNVLSGCVLIVTLSFFNERLSKE